jgi:hypothetical protein
MAIKWFYKWCDWIASKQIGKEKGSCPNPNNSYHGLCNDRESLALEYIGVEDQD